MAMIQLDAALRERGLGARMILQVHDELVLETPDEELNETRDLVKTIMEGVVELRVPIAVDLATGRSWYEAK